MDGTAQGKSGLTQKIAGLKIPEMYSCLIIDDITFSFDRSFFRPARANTIEDDIVQMRSANPSGARLFIYGHTDNVGPDAYNKDLSDRRSRSISSFLSHNYKDWLNLHHHEAWGRIEIQQVVLALNCNGAGGSQPKATLPIEAYIGTLGTKYDNKNLLQLYKDYMEHLISKPLNLNTDFCTPKAFSGCSEFNPVIPASTSKDKTTRDSENEPNRRVVIFVLEPNAVIPCEIGSLKPCYKYRYKPPAKSSNLFTCEFYDQVIINGKCPQELKPKQPSQIPPEKKPDLGEIKVSLGFPASDVEEWILKKYKTDPILFTKILEPLEVNNIGKVVAVLSEEIASLEDESRINKNKPYNPKKPFCLVKTKVYYRQKQFYFKAEVIVRETGEKLFEEEVSAPRLIGIEGYWERSGKYVWRHVRDGKAPRPGYETIYMEGLGIDNFRNDLYLMLCTERKGRWREFKNITEKVKEIMRRRGYNVK